MYRNYTQNPIDYRGWTNFYKHESLIPNGIPEQRLNMNQNPGVEFRSGLYNYQSRASQTPSNFIGVKSIRPPPLDYNTYKMNSMNSDISQLHILRTMPVSKIYNVIC